jgi:hypothetical protein
LSFFVCAKNEGGTRALRAKKVRRWFGAYDAKDPRPVIE